jgi:hypothetical protein
MDRAPDLLPDQEQPRCSARGCRELAVVELRWRNPRLHDAARIKVWPACAGHSDSLADFLNRRRFLLETVPVAGPADPPD